MALGRGESLTEILAARQGVTEGVATAPALVQRAAQLGVDLPICGAVAALVRGEVTVQEAVARLLARPQRDA
jgi:glycerol-3-phosphate dehydrogenase (NAD(P)+)